MSGEKNSASRVKMTVRGLVVDPTSKMPVVILQNPEGDTFLPIWIGMCEANAIALQLEGITPPRPLTHDLILALIETTGNSIDHVFIHSLEEAVFIASIHLKEMQGAALEIDSRPSDAIAIALRAEVDVFVEASVLDRAVVEEASSDDAIRAILERLRPEDLGEYEM